MTNILLLDCFDIQGRSVSQLHVHSKTFRKTRVFPPTIKLCYRFENPAFNGRDVFITGIERGIFRFSFSLAPGACWPLGKHIDLTEDGTKVWAKFSKIKRRVKSW